MDLFTTPQRHGHPNILIITDMDSGMSLSDLRRRHEAKEYDGCHPDLLVEAGILKAEERTS